MKRIILIAALAMTGLYAYGEDAKPALPPLSPQKLLIPPLLPQRLLIQPLLPQKLLITPLLPQRLILPSLPEAKPTMETDGSVSK
ncbi:MAG TPA: hypothetical protein DET40_24525 [Lentisphaeria bacterium]|nr:MAG: hypothetical protein A2X45_22970 [Lentisphaerae bacterium GWF2_50_93]HCE46725.1 hypothetical protein [Lentisphaeria bacterium]